MRVLRAVGGFCVDFVVGDDQKIATAVLLALAVAGGLHATSLPPRVVAVTGGVLLMCFFAVALLVDTRPGDSSDSVGT